MADIAAHIRIFDSDPSDDLVSKRAAAIRDLTARYATSRQVAAILQTANDLAAAVEADGKVLEPLSKEVEDAVRKAGAEAFMSEGQDLQVTVCGLLGALHALESVEPTKNETTVPIVLAIGLWSALGFQPSRTEPKLEALRRALMNSARDLVIASATSSRQRAKVPDPNIGSADPFDAANVAKVVAAGLGSTLNALRTNAAIDREEIDLLWWVLADWSQLLRRRYSSGDNPLSLALSSGIEAGTLLRRLPGDAHRDLVLRHVKHGEAVSLTQLVQALAADRELLGQPFQDRRTLIVSCSEVFPLLKALTDGSTSHTHSKVKRTPTEWASRALLESAALHVTSLLPAVTV